MKTPIIRISRAHLTLSVLLIFLLVASLGCERKPADLEQWRTAKGGMEKMEQWVKSPEESDEVRIRAFQILIEEGQVNQLKPTLEAVSDKALQKQIVAASVPTVEKMWAAKDYPTISEADVEKGGVQVGASESVLAKDAAYFLYPFAEGAEKEKLQKILQEWVSADWQLRNQLGSTTLSQLAEYAGDAGKQSLLEWLKVAVDPGRVADMIKRDTDEETQAQAAQVLLELANEAHPELSPSLSAALQLLEHDELVPYYKKAITDPNSSRSLIGASMDSLVRVQGQRATPFFSDLVANRGGLIRWVSATHIAEIQGKSGLAFVSTALPVEMDTYPGQDSEELKENVLYFCKMFQGEMTKRASTGVHDEIKKSLESSRWPARVLGLKCAEIFEAGELREQVDALKSNRQQVPGWGEATTVGDIATEVSANLSKS